MISRPVHSDFCIPLLSPSTRRPRTHRWSLANASVAIVDEDRSTLSLRIHDALLAPFFFPPGHLSIGEIDEAMDSGRYTFILDIPPNFQADLVAHRHPTIQINVDATAMARAGTGSGYLQHHFPRGSDLSWRGRKSAFP